MRRLSWVAKACQTRLLPHMQPAWRDRRLRHRQGLPPHLDVAQLQVAHVLVHVDAKVAQAGKAARRGEVGQRAHGGGGGGGHAAAAQWAGRRGWRRGCTSEMACGGGRQ